MVRFDVLFFCNFSDNWQCCQRDVVSISKDSQEIGYDWCEDCDVFWVMAQQFFCLMNQIVQIVSNLYGRNSGDNCYDNGNDIEWDVIGFNVNSGKNQYF